jgi:putative transposase
VSREPRVIDPHGVYHITAHGLDDRPIFLVDADRVGFLRRVARVSARLGWLLYAVCLLDTHYHLLIAPCSQTVSEGIRVINGAHARRFNMRHGRRGALFEARYSDRRIRSNTHLLNTLRYIALNPVKGGLADDPISYRWSSYGGLVGVRAPWPMIAVGTVREHFGLRPEAAIAHIRGFVEGIDARVSGTGSA